MTNKIANSTQLTFANPNIPVKSTNISAPETMFPQKIHGLNLPQRVFVLSTILPIMGSTINSKIRTPTIKPVINAISLLATCLLKPSNIPLVTKMIKYVLITP